MAQNNEVKLVGNIGNNPVSKDVNGKQVIDITLYGNSIDKDKKRKFPISFWGEKTRLIESYKKGDFVEIKSNLYFNENQGKYSYELNPYKVKCLKPSSSN